MWGISNGPRRSAAAALDRRGALSGDLFVEKAREFVRSKLPSVPSVVLYEN